MDECWRCASKLIAGSRFCPGCGAAIGSGSGANPVAVKPIEREPADPLAATAPADAAHLAALRRGGAAKKEKSDEPPKTKGRTVPMKASDFQPLPAPVPVQAPAAEPPRRVAKTQADEMTLPSGEPPRVSPKAASTFGEQVRPPQAPPQPQAFQAYVPPPAQPVYQPPAAYPQQPPPYQSQPAYSSPYGPPPPTAPAAPAIGAKVLVEWADGNRYPATVQQCAPGQCLVLFPDGQQRWVDMRRVSNT